MNTRFLMTLCCCLVPFTLKGAGKEDMKWFTDAKFGMFIHWGLYSQTAGDWKGHPTKGGEHFMLYERIPVKEYALIANDFNPTEFNARKWVKTAKEAGMKYIVITSKHHDGFAMYHSACSDYNIVTRTPFARDPMKELADECRKQGLKFGFYYSLGRDWEDPDVPTNWPTKAGRSNTWDFPDEDNKNLQAYIDRKVLPQLTELLTNYGEIAMMWFDTPEMVTKEQSRSIRRLIERLQPHCLINSRIGNGLGDYRIIEQKLMNEIDPKPWEACLTMGANWGYNKYDTVYKKPDMMIRNLTDVVSKGGNLLLNIGPNPQGSFPQQTEPGLNAFRQWIKTNGEAIYGTSPWHTYGETSPLAHGKREEVKEGFHDAVFDGTPVNAIPDFRYTAKGNHVYVIVRHVPAGEFTLRAFKGYTDRIKRITLLDNKKTVEWKPTEEGLRICHIRRSCFPCLCVAGRNASRINTLFYIKFLLPVLTAYPTRSVIKSKNRL